jgi:hypothetical protein
VRLLPKAELLDGEIFYSLREAQVVIESWRRHLYGVASVKGGSGTLGSSLEAPDRLSVSGPSFDMRRQTQPLVSGRGREPRTTISFTATEHASAGAGPNHNSVLKAP